MNIAKIVKKLAFPQSEYIIIGGAALALRGIKETSDIDILVSKSLLEKLKEENEKLKDEDKYWVYHPRIIASEEAGLIHKSENTKLGIDTETGANNEYTVVELYPSIACDTVTFTELKNNQEMIDDIPVAHLTDIIKIKEFYNRDKDKKDIEVARRYLVECG